MSTESSSVTWLPAMQAVADVEAEELMMLPPTYMTCLEVGQHADPASVLAEARGRRVEMFMPELVEDPGAGDGGATLSAPPWMHDLLDSRA